MDNLPSLELHSVTKAFKKTPALNNLSLIFNSGENVLLLGANGSGKSTLLKTCVGLLRPDSGKVLFNKEALPLPPYRQIGYLSHHLFLYSHLSVTENISFYASLFGISVNISQVLEEWNLKQFANKRVHELSRGLQYRVTLARTFLADPRYLLLDEPSSSLDETSVKILSEKIKSNQKNKDIIVIIVTHDLTRLSDLADRVVVMDSGRVVCDSQQLRSVDNKSRAIEEAFNFYKQVNK